MTYRLRIVIASLVLAAMGLSLGVAEAQVAKPGAEKIFRAGAFAIDVTPTKFPVIVNGNSLNPDASTVVDPLHARCLVLDDGTTKIAMVVVDILLIPRPLMDQAKQMAHEKTGIPVDRMLISTTHTHTAPCVYGVLRIDCDGRLCVPVRVRRNASRQRVARPPALSESPRSPHGASWLCTPIRLYDRCLTSGWDS